MVWCRFAMTRRGKHDDFVFVWRRERVQNFEDAPVMAYQPIQTMNHTAWQNARKKAGMPDLHVHDHRHTAGMRLREASLPEPTIRDVLWPVSSSITRHYTVAQIVELHGALEKIKNDSGRWNKSLATLRQEHEDRRKEQRGAKVPQSPPRKRSTKKNGSALLELTR